MAKKKKDIYQQVADLRADKLRYESKRNEIGNQVWRLQRERLALSHKMVACDRAIDTIILKHKKVKYTQLYSPEEKEKIWQEIYEKYGITIPEGASMEEI